MKKKLRKHLAWLSPHKKVLLILIYSLLYILIVEVGQFQELHIICYVLLKFAYSFVAITIFYFVTQYLPKEELKTITYRHTHNKIVTIVSEIEGIPEDFGIEKDASKEKFHSVFKNVNPNDRINSTLWEFDDWCQYLEYKTNTIKNLISDVILHQGYLDIEVLELLYNIDDSISNFLKIDSRRKVRTSPKNASLPIFNIPDYASDLTKIVLSDKMKKYAKKSDSRYRLEKVRQNEKKPQSPKN